MARKRNKKRVNCAPRSWAAMEERARLALERNKQKIESHPRGTPSEKPDDYRVGASVSSIGKRLK
jgi:hypothetical protein